MSENKEWVYWTDKVAQEVKERVEKSQILKKIVEERGYIVYDEKTPSGKIHIGAGRGWVIHDMIAKSMRDQGMKARFILSSDDIDPMDDVPPELDKEKFKVYMGMPLRNIPSPVEGYKSYADYFFTQATNKLDDFNIEAELESTGERYIRGDFNKAIKTILDNADKIKKIYKKTYGKADSKLPFNPICEKCGKIGTTVSSEWDSEKEIVKYVCKPDLVEWAIGCGHEGELSPYDGNGKLPWKVEWAAKWPTVGVVCESAGKDHFTKGGSRTIAVAVACKVLKYPPPWPSTCGDIGPGYEFFLVGGKKMSSSKGLGVSFVEIAEMAPPEILRFLMVKTRPETTIDFTPEGDTIPLLYREFEKTEKIYFGLQKADDRDKNNAKRVYKLSVKNIPKEKPYRIPFDFAAMLIQSLPKENRLERILEILKKIGHIKELSDIERSILEATINYAEIWIEKFAPENVKIRLLKSIPSGTDEKLSELQKLAVKELGRFLEDGRTDKEIWDKIKDISDKLSIKPNEIFQAAYFILIGRRFGPRLVPFIQSLDRGFVSKRFKLEK